MKDTTLGWAALAGALLMFLLPLGTRKVLGKFGSAGDFTRLAVSAVELVGAGFVVGWLMVRRRLPPVRLPIASAAAFLALALVATLASPARAVASIHWVRLGFSVLLALAFVQIGAKSRSWFRLAVGAVLIAGLLQSVIAVGHVAIQHDFGLRLLGESRLAPDLAGAAKLDTVSGKVIRGYGTFPHPNILATFLAVALLAWWWLFVRQPDRRSLWRDAGLALIGIALLAGLAATFSRLGVLAAGGGIAFASWRVWYVPGLRRRFGANARLAAVFVCASAVGLALIFPLWFSRFAVSRNDQAVSLRLKYLRAAGRMVADRPLFGVGPGAFPELLPRYTPGEIPPWQRQPVHSVPVLVLAELGVVGFAALTVFLWRLLKPLCVRAETTEHALVKTLSFGWLVILGISGLGDHFLWAVPQGQMLLWVVVSVVSGMSFRYRQPN